MSIRAHQIKRRPSDYNLCLGVTGHRHAEHLRLIMVHKTEDRSWWFDTPHDLKRWECEGHVLPGNMAYARMITLYTRLTDFLYVGS